MVMGHLSPSTGKGTHLISTEELLACSSGLQSNRILLLTGVLQYLFETDLISQYQSQLKMKQDVSVGEVVLHYQYRGDTTGFSLLLPGLRANHFGYQCAHLKKKKVFIAQQ